MKKEWMISSSLDENLKFDKNQRFLFVTLLVLVLLINVSFISAQKYKLEVTEEHPFYANGGWVVAKNLKIGDELLTSDGKTAKITSIKQINDNVDVYNLEDSLFHNYVTDGNVVVHNSDRPKCINNPNAYCDDPINCPSKICGGLPTPKCDFSSKEVSNALGMSRYLKYNSETRLSEYTDLSGNFFRGLDVVKDGRYYVLVVKFLGDIVFEIEVLAVTDGSGNLKSIHDIRTGRRIVIDYTDGRLIYADENGPGEPLLKDGKPITITPKNQISLSSGLSEPCSECGCSSDGRGLVETKNRKLADTIKNPSSAQQAAEAAANKIAKDNEWIIHAVLKKYRTVWGQIDINPGLYDILVQAGKSELLIAVLEWKQSDGDLTGYLFRRIGKIIRDDPQMSELIRKASGRKYECQYPELEEGKFEDLIEDKSLTPEASAEIEIYNPLERLKSENEALLSRTYGGNWRTIDVYKPYSRAKYFVTVLQNENGKKIYILFDKYANDKVIFDKDRLSLLSIDQQKTIKSYMEGIGVGSSAARFSSALNALRNFDNIILQAKQFAKEKLGKELRVIAVRYDDCKCGKSDFLIILQSNEKIPEDIPIVNYKKGSKTIRVTEYNINELGLSEGEKYVLRQKFNEIKFSGSFRQYRVLITAQGKKILIDDNLISLSSLTDYENDALVAYINGIALNDVGAFLYDINAKTRIGCTAFMSAVNRAIDKIITASQNQQ